MPARGTQILANYLAYNPSAGTLVAGDSANHTLHWAADLGTGTSTQQSTGSAVELGNGKYAAYLTGTNANANGGTIVGTSSSAGVVLVGTDYTFGTDSPNEQAAQTIIGYLNGLPGLITGRVTTGNYGGGNTSTLFGVNSISSAASGNLSGYSLYWTTGLNAGLISTISSYNNSNSTITVASALPNVPYQDNALILPAGVSELFSNLANPGGTLNLNNSTGAFPNTAFANTSIPLSVVALQSGLTYLTPTIGWSQGQLWTQQFNTSTNVSGGLEFWFTVKPKANLALTSDANAAFQIQQSQGLIVCNGSGGTVNASWGSITINNASSGVLTVVLHSPATIQVPPVASPNSQGYVYDIRMRTSASYPDTIPLAYGACVIQNTVTDKY